MKCRNVSGLSVLFPLRFLVISQGRLDAAPNISPNGGIGWQTRRHKWTTGLLTHAFRHGCSASELDVSTIRVRHPSIISCPAHTGQGHATAARLKMVCLC
uniref:Putative secreted protein n=1 Tax=Anopheles triannulatus TaxID=58253 RepID=A0A2M4B3E4_9DIPT